jgi:endonuclease YncB( thermonuclease family)
MGSALACLRPAPAPALAAVAKPVLVTVEPANYNGSLEMDLYIDEILAEIPDAPPDVHVQPDVRAQSAVEMKDADAAKGNDMAKSIDRIAPHASASAPAPAPANPYLPAYVADADEAAAMIRELRGLKRAKVDFSLAGWRTHAVFVAAYDGDTIRMRVPMRIGEMKHPQFVCRLLHYDTPEMRPPLANPHRAKIIAAAKASRDALIARLAADRVVKIRCGAFDRHGRLLIEAWTADGVRVDEWMVSQKHGIPYDGKSKAKAVEAAIAAGLGDAQTLRELYA